MKILRAVAMLTLAAGLLATPSTGGVKSAKGVDLGSRVSGGRAPGPLQISRPRATTSFGSWPERSTRRRDRCRQGPGSGCATAPHFRPAPRSTGSCRCATSGTPRSSPLSARQAHGSPGQFPTTRTWCGRLRRNAMRLRPALRCAGRATTSRRGGSRSPPASGLFELAGTQRYRVHVFADDPAGGAVAAALKQISGVRVLQDSGVVVDIEATAAQLPAIAGPPGRGVDRHAPGVRHAQLQRPVGHRHRRARPLRGDCRPAD